MIGPQLTACILAAATAAGVVIRPFRLPEAVWAVTGAALAVLLGVLAPGAAWVGILKGGDVYLFLTGMMLLAETAREERLFDWLAAVATRQAKGSPKRLFLLVYLVGTVVTVFLSNDATAIVLTPAVAAATRTARVERALPYLLICAFIANAASFVLPISNPANLVIYGSQMPPLLQWLPRFALPSVLSILVTYLVLRVTQRLALAVPISPEVPIPALPRGGKVAAGGIVLTAVALLSASALDRPLGLPTALAGLATVAIVLVTERRSPWRTIRGVSWSILPLVAGLFVLVEALDQVGIIAGLSAVLTDAARRSAPSTAFGGGITVAIISNLVNNLPAGLVAGSAVQAAAVPDQVTSAVLIGVDLGPNLSVTGSLATILWLIALRKEGETISAAAFLRLGLLVMPPALLLALGALLLS